MGFYLISGLMEHDESLTYSVSTMPGYSFPEEDQNMLRDCLLFHCGYLKDEVTSLFNLSIIPKHNLTLKLRTNQNAKPKIPPKPSPKILPTKMKRLQHFLCLLKRIKILIMHNI